MPESSSESCSITGVLPQQIESAHASASALGRLLELCQPYLLHIANAELPDALRAKVSGSDVVQQTFLEATKHYERFQGATERELLQWLRHILLNRLDNCVRDYERTAKRELARERNLALTLDADGDLAVRTDTPSVKAAKQEELELLRQAIERLPGEMRQVVVWRQQEKLSWEEVGARLNRSADAARKLWVRGLARLSEDLETQHGSG